MVPVCESVGFIPYSLQKPKCTRLRVEAERGRAAWAVDFLELLGEADDWEIPKAEALKFVAGRPELAPAAIHNNEIWK